MDSNAPFPEVSPDDVDGALEALWRGRSREFEQLLERGDDGTPGAADRFVGALLQGLGAAAPETAPTVANFVITKELGRGGMGIVYEANQLRPPRTVALKVIRGSSAPRSQQLKLFEREIHSLARLRHPGIAGIHEAGFTEDGRPYFAMELVHGQTLKAYLADLERESISSDRKVRTILRLFVRVCDAINYAHQRGVLHRDVKPSNIIVSDETSRSGSGSLLDQGPEVKVLDFGLARITDVEPGETVTTETGQIRGTLAYMAPEQIRGDRAEIDTRSDVYGLGVLLFEMLTGRLPFDAKHHSVAQMARTICETDPQRPSQYVNALRGDIETIVLKAIEKEPERRYQSAAALGEDVERYLVNQPILARPPSAAYQIRKLIVRHKILFSAATALLLVSTVGATISTVLYVKAHASELEAQEQRLVAERVNLFLVNMFSSLDPRTTRDRDVSLLRELLDDAAARMEHELGNQPRVRGPLESVIGQTYLSLGLYEQADRHLTRAYETKREAFGARHIETLRAMNNLATLRGDTGDLKEAERLHTAALAARRETLGDEHPDTITSMNELGELCRVQNRLTEAQTLLKEAVDLRSRVLGPEHPDTLVSMNNLGGVYMVRRENAKAESLMRAALEGQLRTLPADHLDLLVSKNDLATVLNRSGKLDEAEALFREVVEGFGRQLGEGHMDTMIVSYNLAGLLRGRGSKEEAAGMVQKLVATAEGSLPAGHYLIGAFRSTYARCLLETGRAEEAAPHAARAFEELLAALDRSHMYVKMAADNVVDVYEALEQPELAAPYREYLDPN